MSNQGSVPDLVNISDGHFSSDESIDGDMIVQPRLDFCDNGNGAAAADSAPPYMLNPGAQSSLPPRSQCWTILQFVLH
jgi:hypothetical protein